jgi:hypothetical protein
MVAKAIPEEDMLEVKVMVDTQVDMGVRMAIKSKA